MKNKKFKKQVFVNILLAITLMSLATTGSAQMQASGIKRTELQRYDLSLPGREVVQSRIAFETGASFQEHTHPGEEIIFVLEGLLEYQVAGQPPVILKAGDVLFIPAGTIHAARNVGKKTGIELATYIVEKGKPLLVMTHKALK